MSLAIYPDAHDLQREFARLGRDYYSIEAYKALVEYFNEIDCDEDTELDVIAICGDFTESTIEEIAQDYDIDVECDDDYDYCNQLYDAVWDYLQGETWAVDTGSGNILYREF